MNSTTTKLRVLFLCLGNICRSPTAHAIFEKKVRDAGLAKKIIIDSCGTGDWHIGKAADPRAIEFGKKHGYDLSTLRARQLQADDFVQFDYILAMDLQNMQDARAMYPADYSGELMLFLDVLAMDENQQLREVPDPYYGGGDGFDRVIQLCELASDAWLKRFQSLLGE